MRSHTPQGGDGSHSRRSSNSSNRFRASVSGLPRPQAPSVRESRISFRASQPTNNHTITGIGGIDFARAPSQQSMGADSGRPSSRESYKENVAPPDADEYEKYRREIESLKAEIGTLQYRMQTSESEKEIALSQQSNRVEQARRREQEEAQLRRLAESQKAAADEKIEAAWNEMDALKKSVDADKRALERRARQAEDEARLLQEQLEDLANAKDEAARMADKKTSDLQIQVTAIQSSLNEAEEESRTKDAALQQVQAQLLDRDAYISDLEADVLRLKAHSGDAETMQIIKTELSEQVAHIRALEATNRHQLGELKRLRATNKAVEVVEEEKRTLMRKVDAAVDLERELAEERLQRQRLSDERLAWTSYLEREGDDDMRFDSPEEMARALAEERINSASQLEHIGELQAKLSSYEATMASMEDNIAALKAAVEETKSVTNAVSADKALMRVERQRALAVKEVEYLRAQLKTFDVEDETMQPEQHDEARAVRIHELETVIDEYKAEVQKLHAELSAAEAGGTSSGAAGSGPSTPQASAGSKRQRSSYDDGGGGGGGHNDAAIAAANEQIGQLMRKNHKLQQDTTSMKSQIALMEKDLMATRGQLRAAKHQSSTRVLSLRSNPTADHEAVKRATLDALQKENRDLLATLQSREASKPTDVPYIPKSVLGAMERQVAAAKAETASAQKSARRLKEVWASKSNEFKEAIFSTLGWTVTFIPNGKMRVESTFFPSQTDENENSIIFDGERGTMKVGGGPKSPFAQRISDQIGFWVREKGCIPGFLAALTLEFYEEHNNRLST
ncbi:mitotic spindle assembly checkpoint protein MAD1 [Geosmithia morbida]|uniref:Spindle assembly checkpoint component MAD1 n=1 Tax=Geosmithia morbida TaxID=1094350 RepID=A0A9P5D0T7_9HYPO|nr:mitotic spindle assembly checkpoint protein MAD1 [Geosmithia morbida]KAF4123078.1 mitotic spindle assembly checkpoint protein MAD1 [Geosmithia morbida]